MELETLDRDAQHTQPNPGNSPPNLLIVPDFQRSQVLQWGHFSKLSCHPGFKWTLQFIRQPFWWPSMSHDTQVFISACSICACSKSSHPAGQLCPLPVPKRPWSQMAVDFVTGLPPSNGKTTNSPLLTISPKLCALSLCPNYLQL